MELMIPEIELLAPGGDLDSVKAAIAAGADAVYCGLNKFNARNRATNIELEDLRGIIGLAHRHDCQIFLTINVVIIESEFKALFSLLNSLANTDLDAVIVQDLGLFYLLSRYFKSLKIHASTQVTTHNAGQVKFLSQLGATRVNLSRELNLTEIKALALVGHENNIQTEVFVHGSNCISFSGLCYISSVLEGKSGNRGRCSQPCREQYQTTPAGLNFPLNLKDNSAFNDLEALHAAGVDSLKIEGRVKKFHYVYTVVKAWRKRINNFYASNRPAIDDSDLYRVFNRGFTNAFLQGDINQQMFIDNPRDNSAQYYAELGGCSTDEGMDRVKKELHDTKTRIIEAVRDEIKEFSIDKTPLSISFAGEAGTPLRISVRTQDKEFELCSETMLTPAAKVPASGKSKQKSAKQLDAESIKQRLGSFSETEHYLQPLELEQLEGDLFLPFKELSALKNRMLFILNGEKDRIEPVALPLLEKTPPAGQPSLAVLLSSLQDLPLCRETSAELYFQLPSCFKQDYSELIALFLTDRQLIPWFPAVLIGSDYAAAIDILTQTKPQLIVTNNTGIAFEASLKGIAWLAGPSLNIVNSFSLLCLKERFNCAGAFVSNELSKNQMRNIVRPENFKLCYSIYQPLLLLISRQCLHHQIDGCEKNSLDQDCGPSCSRSSSIRNTKDVPLFVDKSAGYHHRIFNQYDFLNTEIVSDLPGIFSSFLIDLTGVKTDTRVIADKVRLIKTFEKLLLGNPVAKNEIETMILPTTNAQYHKGI